MNPSHTNKGGTAVLTPAAVGTAVPVKGTTRKFRKMILPRKRVKAGQGVLDLASYYPSLIKAEKDRAFDTIALQVHDTHTKDPRYTEGAVSNLAHEPNGPDGDGLYADIEFADDEGVKLVQKSLGRVGVSVSMVQNLEREEDGKRYSWPAALQHVLMTTDPHVRGMGGWHPIELGRTDVETTIDLSNKSYEEIEEEPMAGSATKDQKGTEEGKPTDGAAPTEPTNDKVTLEVTPEERDQLVGLLAELKNLDGSGSREEGAPAGAGRPDLAAAGAPTNLDRESAEGGESDEIQLMRNEIETERQARIDLTRELHAARAATEIQAIMDTGLAPSIVEKARPLLELERGSGVIELSRDSAGRVQKLDPTQVIRDVLFQVVELSRQGLASVDLDREEGLSFGSDAEKTQHDAQLKAWADAFPEN